MKRFLALLMCLCLMPFGCMAEEPSFLMPLTFGGTVSVPYACALPSFSHSSFQFNPSLCMLSLQMALSSFGIPNELPDANVIRFLSEMGFESIQTEDYDSTAPDSIGTAMGCQFLSDKTPLIALVIRSSNYGLEWVSNFDSSLEENHHRGFYLSARKVMQRVQVYLSENCITKSPIIWLSGYSRGAAVANITAALLSDHQIVSDERIFAYTFATPATVLESESHRHLNIFNILQYGDLVTHVPLTQWGFSRYGTSFYLPSSAFTKNYESFVDIYQTSFRFAFGTEDAYAHDVACVNAVLNVVDVMKRTVPTIENYHLTYENIFKKAILGETLTSLDMTFIGLLLSNTLIAMDSENAANYRISGDFSQIDQEKIIQLLTPCIIKHMPESYWAALSAISETTGLSEQSFVILP